MKKGGLPVLLTRSFSRIAVSYAHLRSILGGLKPSVRSLGMLTAWNPGAQPADSAYNQRANKELLRDLRERGFGAIPIGGAYGGIREGSFLVPNIDRGFLLELCAKYDQETVIYGERTEAGGRAAFRFEMLDRTGNLVARPETQVISTEDVYHRDTNYSHLGGETRRKPGYPGQTSPTRKRFFIPFDFSGSGEGGAGD